MGPGTGSKPKRAGKPSGLTERGKRLKGSGTLTPSPARLQRTRVQWLGATLPESQDGYGLRTLPATLLADDAHAHKNAVKGRPLMLYFHSDGRDDDLALEFAERLWNDDGIGLASRLFNCYRLSLDDMSPADRKKYGGKSPRIVFLSPEGKTISALKGWNISSSALLKKQSQVVRKQWSKNLARLLPKHAEILRALDETHIELEKSKRTLASTKEHLRVHNCAPGQKRLKRTEKAIKDLTALREKTLADEKKLYAFAAPKAQVTSEKAPAKAK